MANFDAILALTQKTYKFIEAKLLSDANSFEGTKYRRSGCYAFDWILANHNTNGGLPRGKIIEIAGPEGSGKTTLATVCAASVNKYKDRNKVLFLDYEHKYDLRYALSLGIIKDKFYFSQPNGPLSGVAGLELLINAIDADDIGLIIVDSLPAVMSKEEGEGDLTDANIGAQARLWGKALRKMINGSNSNSPTVIIINQMRDNIGAMFGPKEKTAGGRSIKFSATCRIDIRAKEKQKEDEENEDTVTSQNVQIKAIKNQCGENFQSTETELIFGEGYNNEQWVLDKAIELGVTILTKKTNPRKMKFTDIPFFGAEEMNEITVISLLEGSTQNLNHLYELCIQKKQKVTAESEAAALKERSLKEERKNSAPEVVLETAVPDFS